MSQPFVSPETKVPSSSGGYMKFNDGDNKIRILSHAITGTEGWVKFPDGTKKPVRKKESETWSAEELAGLETPQFGEKTRYFWAFVVWNMADSEVQILFVRQKGILKALEEYIKDADWGDPREYGINIKKSGTGKETEYNVIAVPHSPVDPAIIKAYQEKHIDLDQLFVGGDPFEVIGGEEEVATAEDAKF